MALFCSIPFRQYAPVLDNIRPSEYPLLHVIGAPNSVKTAERTGDLIMNSRNITKELTWAGQAFSCKPRYYSWYTS
ncbi:hypothetical protein OUZ56_029337 [Daphnia magna]|uniref:Uncharacterized protein n=1 Tax=Daphnia magna TaxID=35525 RepID=A0ABR0B6I6_9CRUS|nr:hypothetical protein OUZ56_029337 [Daphnia magna]